MPLIDPVEHAQLRERRQARRDQPLPLLLLDFLDELLDVVDVGMREQVLAPGVKNTEDTDLRVQVLAIRGDFQRVGGAGGEERMVKPTGVVLRQQIELMRDGKDDMKVVGGQEFAFPGREPAFTRPGQGLRAVPCGSSEWPGRLSAAGSRSWRDNGR